MKELESEDFTAVFCISDKMCGGVYDLLEERGLVAGKDISVAGYDDSEIAAYFRPGLTTMAIDLKEIGRVAARKLIDEMTADYEAEQKELKEDIEKKTKLLESSEQKKVDMRMLLKGLRAFSECRTLTPEILNMLIERIEVHKSEKIDGKKRVKVDVYFTAIGMIDIPTEAEIAALTEEIRNNPDKMKLIA